MTNIFMQKLFNKILVPVDFSSRTKTIAEKAMDIAKQYNCSIHLLHVFTISPFSAVVTTGGHTNVPYEIVDNKKELEYRLASLVDYIGLLSDRPIKVDYSLLMGSWDQAIIDLINLEGFDLVIIGQKGRLRNKRKMFLNPDSIAAKTNIPVITVPSNRRLTKLYSIVIPITDFLPVRKLMYGIYIASKYNTTLKLLGIETQSTSEKVRAYSRKAYELVYDNSTVKVELQTIAAENVAEAVNNFALANSADLIIVNPGTQTKMPGLFSSLLGRVLQKYSAPPVLTINAV